MRMDKTLQRIADLIAGAADAADQQRNERAQTLAQIAIASALVAVCERIDNLTHHDPDYGERLDVIVNRH
jgi:hypothetical protein